MGETTDLWQAAVQARGHACCRYSGFAVGAALLDDHGVVDRGCNIENASYGLTVCAERVALWKALSEGRRRFKAIAVVTDSPRPTPPCGPCRQLLWEYCGDISVILGNREGVTRTTTLAELFPEPFDDGNLATE